jgi:hypothetical protein
MAHRRVNQIYDPVLSVEISATKVKRLVYLLVANRPIPYDKGYSRIVYVGTTGKGVRRIAASASNHIIGAGNKLKGIRRLDAYVIWSKSKAGPQTKKGAKFWGILERAVLLRFRELYQEPPHLNGTGHKMKERNEFAVYRRGTIDRIILRYT